MNKKPFPRVWFASLVCGAAGCFLLNVSSVYAQSQPAGSLAAAETHDDDDKDVPTLGWNFSLAYAAEHNSSTGWSNALTPTLSYRINEHFFLDSSVPFYLSANAYISQRQGLTTTDVLMTKKGLLGDTSVAGGFNTGWKDLHYSATATGGFPTGNYKYGLTANTMTYNVTNHVDYSLGVFTPDIEFGIGDSSSLANQSVRKSYTAVGTIANFQAGTSIDFPWDISLDLEGYENLPIGNQNVYGTITRTNKAGKTRTREVLQGTGVAEDNGVNTELDIPLGGHFVLGGTYERSFVQGLDSVSVSLTWTLRKPKHKASH